MSALIAALLIAALVAFVVWLLSGPFRAAAPATTPADSDERRALESAKEAKYAEIRDNETTFAPASSPMRTSACSTASLRAEAVEILRAIDELDSQTSVPTD